ncbi:xanthine dehydrogenase family protein molybdopterin-binding subunit [Jiangella ureilytica]|uniref:Xanthine dehydrogenase family protein molybdopterin-binding subunit n=1 Tax=Jiangella ureilytica TaxID=2530374 RepID=A0A4R4RDJ1_9ACTN|nr:xanthine dehydrogenase family protein molybdopterin-binding subunit [Jiangella ureilytica]TDC47234.1 xanthine dehydrogenase family protein molybdopterin-binding subunit [Jiangella ureilytica]
MGENVVGQSVRRPDLVEKVTGAAEYCVDVTMPGMAHAKVVRSDRAHARITGIDVAEALAAPGVVAVVTAADIASLHARFGHIITDHWILAPDKVRYYGEPVAVVVAETVAAAADAVELVRVSYEDLPAVMDAEAALADGAPLVHEQAYEATGDESFKNLSHVDEGDGAQQVPSNVAHEVTIGWGEVDAAFADSAVVVENTVHFPMLYAYAMEPYNAVASYAEGALSVVSTAQHPYMVRDDLARVFDLPLSRVRVTSPYLGGGYGSKSYTKVEPLASVASWVTGRPVKLTLTVEEAIYTTRVDSAKIWVKSGFAADGTILAREFDVVMDSGAYADNSPLVMAKTVNRCFGPYRVPNLRVRGLSVYTNTSPASSYRGFGAPQGALAGETNLDRAAEQLGISGADIRRRNLVRKGEEILPGKRGIDADIPADLEMVVESLERDRKDVPYYGIGFGCTASDAGAYPISTAQVRIQIDGSVLVLSGSTEMGQGSRSLLAQVAAEELGVDLAVVKVVQSDTSVTPYERTTGASRTSTLVGLALQRACADARSRMRDMAAELFECAPGEVRDRPGAVAAPDGRELDFGSVVRQWFGGSAGEVTGVGLLRRDGATQKMPPFWEVGMVGVAVEIDPETGVVAVDQLVTVADVGFAINPRAVEGQDLGAATQGLGMALHEELVYDGPQLANANVVDYRVPRTTDLPRKIDLMIAERRDGVGPYGAKGAGEGTLNPIGGAVAAAVARAVGRWPDRLPLTPERVWRLMNRD